jgi:type I restriction enzyme R subunit
MHELDLQGGYLLNFLCSANGLGYKEVTANTVSEDYVVEEDLKAFLSETSFNQGNYRKLLRNYANDEKTLFNDLITFLLDRVKSSANMALFFNSNKNFTFQGLTFTLYAPSGSELKGDKDFKENIFSVVQELPYKYKHDGKILFSFRPDITFFLNGFYLGYSELKSNWNNQDARKEGRKKVINDYRCAVEAYLKIANGNDVAQSIRRNLLRIFDKAIHITTTDIQNTYVLRNTTPLFDEIKLAATTNFDFEQYQRAVLKVFKAYPLRNPQATQIERFEEVFRALYSKLMIEKEILYYNFLERELIVTGKGKKEYKHNDGRLIAPRPKQKFGADKIVDKIAEFIDHEKEPDYFIKKLEAELRARGASEPKIQELVGKRLKYQNNKNVYSLLLQYAAGFGKSNIIGWTALQLKNMHDGQGKFIYNKILIVVDRLQLRDQLDTMLHNMNIQKGMFIEAHDKASFKRALSSSERIVVVNIQKFSAVTSRDNATTNQFMDETAIARLASMRVCFIIDEVHRSNSGDQHEEMVSLFDELQSTFDNNDAYKAARKKKNLIIGFTATPSDHTLARFGEYNKYAEGEKLWIPFDSYTMKEAIEDDYIFNPLRGIVPVSAKMYFQLPENKLEGFEGDTGYDDKELTAEEIEKRYQIRKEKIYSDPDRINAIAHFVVDRLLSAVYHNIRGAAKAMLAVSSIPNAIKYKKLIDRYYPQAVAAHKKYERFSEAPIYIVYSERQGVEAPNGLNGGINEKQVLQNFKLAKNGLIIVVDKLQTGFDEPKLHTLFLDKEIKGINAIQTISRVNRITKDKNDCKIVDFSHLNINVKNIKQAFEHFSNVVVSDFAPLEDEKTLLDLYIKLKKHELFVAQFKLFKQYSSEYTAKSKMLEIETAFRQYIKHYSEKAQELKTNVNSYFRILNLIEFVIELDKKLSEELFIEFWHKYSVIYRQATKTTGTEVDDVEIYFDNKIGILVPLEDEPKGKPKGSTGGEPPTGGSGQKYNILKEIERRNKQEEKIKEQIEAFEKLIDEFFEFIQNDTNGKRLIAKIKNSGNAFSYTEKLSDFSKLYTQYTIKNRSKLNTFFLQETKGNMSQLFDDFERNIQHPVFYIEQKPEQLSAATPKE